LRVSRRVWYLLVMYCLYYVHRLAHNRSIYNDNNMSCDYAWRLCCNHLRFCELREDRQIYIINALGEPKSKWDSLRYDIIVVCSWTRRFVMIEYSILLLCREIPKKIILKKVNTFQINLLQTKYWYLKENSQKYTNRFILTFLPQNSSKN